MGIKIADDVWASNPIHWQRVRDALAPDIPQGWTIKIRRATPDEIRRGPADDGLSEQHHILAMLERMGTIWAQDELSTGPLLVDVIGDVHIEIDNAGEADNPIDPLN